MASINLVVLSGNLTRDPEVKFLPNGTAVGNMSLAVNSKWRDKEGKDHDEVCFVSCVAFGAKAEACGKYLAKGSPVLVEGRLKYESWEKDGKKMNALKLLIDKVIFMGSKAPRDDAPAGEQSHPKPAEDVDDANLPF